MFLSPTERVAKGAKLLDTKVPGWAEKIDLQTLSIRYDCTCMIGQIFGSYTDDVVKLDIESDSVEAIEAGFYVPGKLSSPEVVAEYDKLTDAWTDEVAARWLEAA